MRAQLVAAGLQLVVRPVPARIDELARQHGPDAKPQDGQKATAPPHRLMIVIDPAARNGEPRLPLPAGPIAQLKRADAPRCVTDVTLP
jgi:hypothetical protein